MKRLSAGWRQVACCFVLLSCLGSISGSYGIVAAPLGKEFGSSRMALMTALTVMGVVGSLLSPFVGSLMDRRSVRRMMIAGALLLSVGYAAMSLITSFNHALIIFGLIMAPAGVMLGPVATTVLISRWFTEKRGAAIGIAIAGVAMGTIVFPPLLQSLFDHFDWRTAFQLYALLMLVLALPAALLVIDRPAGSDQGADTRGAKPANTQAPVRVILGDPAFWIATGIFVSIYAGMKGIATNLAPMATDVGVRPIDAALLVSIFGTAALVSKLSFAVVADRIGTRALMLFSFAGFAIGMGCMAYAATGFWTIAAGTSCIGLAGGLMTPMQSYLIPRIFGMHSVGRAYGLMSMVMFVFLQTTPPLFGRIYDVTGSYSVIFLTFVALAVCCMIAVPWLRLQTRHESVAAQSAPV